MERYLTRFNIALSERAKQGRSVATSSDSRKTQLHIKASAIIPQRSLKIGNSNALALKEQVAVSSRSWLLLCSGLWSSVHAILISDCSRGQGRVGSCARGNCCRVECTSALPIRWNFSVIRPTTPPNDPAKFRVQASSQNCGFSLDLERLLGLWFTFRNKREWLIVRRENIYIL